MRWHGQLADALRGEGRGGVPGDPEDERGAGTQLHDEEHRHPGQVHAVDLEEPAASRPAAWVRRNARHVVVRERRGAGGMPCSRGTRRTIEAATRRPKRRNSFWIRVKPQVGLSVAIRTIRATSPSESEVAQAAWAAPTSSPPAAGATPAAWPASRPDGRAVPSATAGRARPAVHGRSRSASPGRPDGAAPRPHGARPVPRRPSRHSTGRATPPNEDLEGEAVDQVHGHDPRSSRNTTRPASAPTSSRR